MLTALRALTRRQSAAGVVMLAFPHGGQRVARRNVRDAMASDRLRAQARSEAAAAIQSLGRRRDRGVQGAL